MKIAICGPLGFSAQADTGLYHHHSNIYCEVVERLRNIWKISNRKTTFHSIPDTNETVKNTELIRHICLH